MQESTWNRISTELVAEGVAVASARFGNKRAAPGFVYEADWTCYGTGCEVEGRWLITSVSSGAIGSGAERWLIAYEIDANDAPTGRVIQIVGPITEDDDGRLLAAAKEQDWWNRDAPDLAALADWVDNQCDRKEAHA
jgi:hypothetical protein